MKSVIVVCSLLVTVAFGRTVRYQIVTHDNGTKEILSNQRPSSDIKVLAKDLNASLAKFETTSEAHAAETENSDLSETSETADALPLLNQLNSYTANGWTGQNNTVYANSTKLVVLDDTPETHVVHKTLLKKGRSENVSDFQSVSNDVFDETDAWNVINHLYDCFINVTNHTGTVECLKDRVTSMFYRFLDHSFRRNLQTGEEKAYLHSKKLLKGALLPLLVFLVIKYLVALPVLAAGLITIKTFWLSLLSAGVAAFGAPWKHQHSVIKGYRPDGDAWSQPPWVVALHSNDALNKMSTVTDKYFM